MLLLSVAWEIITHKLSPSNKKMHILDSRQKPKQYWIEHVHCWWLGVFLERKINGKPTKCRKNMHAILHCIRYCNETNISCIHHINDLSCSHSMCKPYLCQKYNSLAIWPDNMVNLWPDALPSQVLGTKAILKSTNQHNASTLSTGQSQIADSVPCVATWGVTLSTQHFRVRRDIMCTHDVIEYSTCPPWPSRPRLQRVVLHDCCLQWIFIRTVSSQAQACMWAAPQLGGDTEQPWLMCKYDVIHKTRSM